MVNKYKLHNNTIKVHTNGKSGSKFLSKIEKIIKRLIRSVLGIEKKCNFKCVLGWPGCTITSKAKINFFRKFSAGPFGAAPFEFFLNTLILAFEANRALSHQNALFPKKPFLRKVISRIFYPFLQENTSSTNNFC